MKRHTVLLADDHVIVAEGLRSLLEPEFELVGMVQDGRALLKAADTHQPDVIVTDISMPTLNGLDAVRQLKKQKTSIKVIILTMHSDALLATEAFRAGAAGYVLKHSAGEELVAAIHTVLDGRTYVSPNIKQEVLEAFMKAGGEPGKAVIELTPRQREVLQLVAEGQTMKEIASILNISTRTVESHKYEMMQKLGTQTTAGLIQYAIKLGLVST